MKPFLSSLSLLTVAGTFAASSAQILPAPVTVGNPAIACVGKLTGLYRYVNAASACINGLETPLVFNPNGVQGPQGPAGIVGPAGPQGAMGATGMTGATGPKGPMGLTGAQGQTGATGAQGPRGMTGTPGASGPQGPAGNQGSAGSTGPAGATGAAGPQGPQGAPGTIGFAANNTLLNSSYSNLFAPVVGLGTFVVANTSSIANSPQSLSIPIGCTVANFTATVAGVQTQNDFQVLLYNIEAGYAGSGCNVLVPSGGGTTSCTSGPGTSFHPGDHAAILMRVNGAPELDSQNHFTGPAYVLTSFTCQ